MVELEESRSKLLQENQHLTDNVSSLQFYIQNLENNMSSGPSSDEVKKVYFLSLLAPLYSCVLAICFLIEANFASSTIIGGIHEIYLDLSPCLFAIVGGFLCQKLVWNVSVLKLFRNIKQINSLLMVYFAIKGYITSFGEI